MSIRPGPGARAGLTRGSTTRARHGVVVLALRAATRATRCHSSARILHARSLRKRLALDGRAGYGPAGPPHRGPRATVAGEHSAHTHRDESCCRDGELISG